MKHDAIIDLSNLLRQVFTPSELHAWLPNLPDGDRIVSNLPGGNAPLAQFFFGAVDIFNRWGLLKLTEFWVPLEKVAPYALKTSVVELAARFGVTVSVTTTQSEVHAPPVPRQHSPTQIIVLFASASPIEEERLRVDKEFRKITQKVRGTRFRDKFRFEVSPAARFEDLLTALQEHEPHILHISSHGMEDGSLKFEADTDDEDDDGIVSKVQFLGALKALRDNLRVVLINACYSEKIARDIPPNIDVAIGMNTTVPDSAAINFASLFYESLGFGRTVESAFEVALAKLKARDNQIPRLYPLAEQDPEKKRKLKLIPPRSV